jgi:hypothetical protein
MLAINGENSLYVILRVQIHIKPVSLSSGPSTVMIAHLFVDLHLMVLERRGQHWRIGPCSPRRWIRRATLLDVEHEGYEVHLLVR